MTSLEKIVRKTPIWSDHQDKTFENPARTRKYSSQFNSLYTYRSNELKSRVLKLANPKWKDVDVNGEKPKFIPKVLDVPFLKPVYIIGTTLADMKYKPNVLKEVELSVQGHFQELNQIKGNTNTHKSGIESMRRASYSDPKTDKLWLEDESGRILLTGDLLNEKIIVTGLVIGVLGIEVESGIFHVVDIVYPEAAEQKPIPAALNQDGKLLLCSGLNISHQSSLDKYEILKSWIFGDLGDQRAQTVNEMILVGNSVDVSQVEHKAKTGKDKYTDDYGAQFSKFSVEYLDSFIDELTHSVPVCIVPGPGDIVELGLPKPPLHKSFFNKSSRKGNFKRLTDPVFHEVNGLRILISSGETINDIMKYIIPNINDSEDIIDESVCNDSRLRVIEDSLLWQIVAPTAPDTLCCYPFEDKDPFTLVETPHVYIVGNQPKFETSMVELKRKNGDVMPVRIISVPAFDESRTCVLLDLKTLACELLKVDI